MTILALDHIAVVGRTLAEAASHVERAIGVAMLPGGQHPAMGTHNMLLSLGKDAYLEAIAVDPDAVSPGRPRWFGLDEWTGEPRLAVWIVRGGSVNDVPKILGTRRRMTRGDLSWEITVRDDGRLPFDGAIPGHIDWGSKGTPAPDLPGSGCLLSALEVRHPEANAILDAWPDLGRLPNARVMGSLKFGLRAIIATTEGARILE